MDHLPRILNPSRPPLEVPCLQDDRFKYDGLGLSDFPGRIGFNYLGSDDGISMRDRTSFIQHWLFFGSLQEIFGLYDIKVVDDDFIRFTPDERCLITTAYLEDYMTSWIMKEHSMNEFCLEPQYKTLGRGKAFKETTPGV